MAPKKADENSIFSTEIFRLLRLSLTIITSWKKNNAVVNSSWIILHYIGHTKLGSWYFKVAKQIPGFKELTGLPYFLPALTDQWLD